MSWSDADVVKETRPKQQAWSDDDIEAPATDVERMLGTKSASVLKGMVKAPAALIELGAEAGGNIVEKLAELGIFGDDYKDLSTGKNQVSEGISAVEKMAAKGREAQGREGTDWMDVGGQIASPLNIKLMKAMPVASGVTGLARLPQAAKNIAVGGAAGAATGVMTPVGETDNYTEDKASQMKTGTLMGAAGAGIFDTLRAVGAGAGNVVGPHIPKIDAAAYLPEVIRERARQYLPKAMQGDTSGAERAALKILTDERLGEVEKAGLRKLMESHSPTLARDVKAAAVNSERAQLEKLAQGGNQEEAIKSGIKAKQALNEEVVPKMNVELDAANTAGKKGRVYRALIAQKEASNKSAMQDAGQMYSEFGNQANQAWKTAGAPQSTRIPATDRLPGDPPFKTTKGHSGMGWAGEQKIARNTEQGIKNYEGAAAAAEIGKQRLAEKSFYEKQLGSMEEYGLRPLKADSVIGHIEGTINTPTIQGTVLEKKILQGLNSHLKSLADESGNIDSYALSSFRKSGINGVIDDLTRGMEKSSKEHAQGLLVSIKNKVDDALEAAGGTEWRSAMQEYSKGMHKIDQQGMAATALKLHETSPQKLVDLAKGNATEVVEGQFGKGKFSFTDEMNTINELPKGQVGPPTLDTSKSDAIKKVAEAVGKRIEADDLGGKGAQKAMQILRAEESAVTAPGMISWKVTAANKVINALAGQGGSKTNDALAKFMLSDTARMDKLMKGLPPTKQQMLIDAIIQRASITGSAQQAAQNK